MLIDAWADVLHPVIGMLHLPPLAGSPRYGGDRAEIRRRVLEDARTLTNGGVHGLILENFGDTPFFPRRVPASTVAQMTALAAEVGRACHVPLGINVLRNDGLSALAVTHAIGGDFIRVNVLCGARVADQGILEGVAHELLRERVQLGADGVKILADVRVKHSAPLAPARLEDEVHDAVERGGADGLIATGSATGQAVDLEQLGRVKAAAGETPVFVGSGISAENIAQVEGLAAGFIVGTSLKYQGVASNPVDPQRVAALMEKLK